MTQTTTPLDSPLEPGRIYYFIHPRPPIATLAFIREENGSARVLGGRTGSHRTGHGESWWKAFAEIVSLGYMPAGIARQQGVIPAAWQPPALEP